MVDVIFEMIFVLYPILFFMQEFTLNTENIIKTSAIMNTENGLLFLQALLPSLVLCKQMFFGPRYLMTEIKRKWAKSKSNTKNATSEEQYYNENSCWTMIRNKDGLKFINPDKHYIPIYKNTEDDIKRYKKQQCCRKCSLLMIVLCILAFGIGICAYVGNHYKMAHELCDNYVNSDNIVNHSRMRVWNEYCTVKVYPFVKDNELPCQCRSLMIQTSDMDKLVTIYNTTSATNTIIDALERFHQLEAVSIRSRANSLESIELTAPMFSNEKMRVFHIEGITIDAIDSNIQNWKNIQYLTIQIPVKTPLSLIPLKKELSQLKKLKHISLEHFVVGDMEFICFMKQLNNMLITYSVIETIPDCILNNELKELKIIQWDHQNVFAMNEKYNETFKKIEKLFLLPSLQELSLFNTEVSLWDFSTNQFDYNPNVNYIFDNTPNLCGMYFRFHSMVYLFSKHLFYFLQHTKACANYVVKINETLSYDAVDVIDFITIWYPINDGYYQYYFNKKYDTDFLTYKYDTVFTIDEYTKFLANKRLYFCAPNMYANGYCDEVCNDVNIGFDGGDCMQLCNFDECTPNLWKKSYCSSSCNNTECNYNLNICSPGIIEDECIQKSGYTQCVTYEPYNETESKGLLIERGETWIQDQWCQDPCNIFECNWDNRACTSCQSSPLCSQYREYYGGFTGNTFQMSQQLFEFIGPFAFEQFATDPSWDIDNLFGFNMTDIFNIFDIDKNGYFNAYELMVALHSGPLLEGFSWVNNRKEFKWIGSIINCSLCFPNVDIYYQPWIGNQRQYYISNTKQLINNQSYHYFYP